MSPPWKTGVAENPIALLKKNSNKATGLRFLPRPRTIRAPGSNSVFGGFN
jgi:hypothetical protein